MFKSVIAPLYLYAGSESSGVNILVPLISTSFVVSLFLIFIFGLLIGVILTKCNFSPVKKKPTPSVPVYEEVIVQADATIKLEDNVAYGQY